MSGIFDTYDISANKFNSISRLEFLILLIFLGTFEKLLKVIIIFVMSVLSICLSVPRMEQLGFNGMDFYDI
jgi:hypothetical protein